MRARGKLDALPPIFVPVQDGHDHGNINVAGHIQHPQAASRRGELGSQIPNITVAKPIEIDLGALQAVVPPDRDRIPLDEFEETLEDRFLKRIAGRAAVRSRH